MNDAGLAGMGAAAGPREPERIPLGARIWEIMNPEQVQAEYEALGQTPPSKVSIIAGNMQVIDPVEWILYGYDNIGRSADAVAEAAQNAGAAAGDALEAVGNNAVKIGIVAALLYVGYQATKRYGAGK